MGENNPSGKSEYGDDHRDGYYGQKWLMESGNIGNCKRTEHPNEYPQESPFHFCMPKEKIRLRSHEPTEDQARDWPKNISIVAGGLFGCRTNGVGKDVLHADLPYGVMVGFFPDFHYAQRSEVLTTPGRSKELMRLL